MTRLRLQVSIPTAGLTRASFTRSLANTMGVLGSQGLPRCGVRDMEVRITDVQSANWFGNREQLVMSALREGMTHVVFFDDDMSWDSGIVDLLMSRLVGTNRRVVVTNYLVKTEPCDRWVAGGLDGKQVETLESSTGLQEVAFSGFGASVIDLRVMRDMPHPWFLPRWQEDEQTYTTEDVAFFERLRKHAPDVAVWLDHDASKMITGHHGARSWHWTDYRPKDEP